MTEGVVGWCQRVYNRPAEVTAIYSEVAKIRWQDNGTLGFVPLDELGKPRSVDTDTEQ
jgi:hypothetical protein